MIYYVLNNLT